jgi:capsular exopolysaccharide synthesis family protein
VEPSPVLRSSLTPQPAAGTGDGAALREYAGALRRYWWLVLAAAVVTVAGAWWKLRNEVPQFTTSAAVRLVDVRRQIAGDLGNSTAESYQGWYTDPIQSQIQLLKSRAVAGDVVDSLGLRLVPADPSFPRSVLWTVAVDPRMPVDSMEVEFRDRGVRISGAGFPAAEAPYGGPVAWKGVRLTVGERPADVERATFRIGTREDAINGVLGLLQARPREMTNVIDIGYTAPDPHLAQSVVNGAANAFQRLNAASARQQSRRRHLFIEEQLRSTDSMLMVAQLDLSSFRRGVEAFSSREKFNTTAAGLTDLTLRRDELGLELGVYQQMGRELQQDRVGGDDRAIAALAASPQVASNGGMVRLYENYINLQTARDTLTKGDWSFALTNPDVVRIDSLRVAAKRRLEAAVDARVTALQGQIAAVERIMGADAARMRALPDAEAEESRLLRQVETLQKLVDDLLLERQKARIDEAVEQGGVEIVDPALLPQAPMGTGTSRKLLFALLLGLVLGGGGAVVLDKMNTAILRREDVESLLHLPALGIIPRIAGEGSGRRRLRLPASVQRRLPRPAPDADDPLPGLITLSDLHSAGSQAYRKLRTHLVFSHGGPRLKTILVTSPAAGEGKSTICSNLAVTFAQQQLRVVLVDGDLRRARLHNVFDVPRLPGIPEVLGGFNRLDEALRPTAVENLWVLPAGRLVPNASELLGSSAMEELLDALAKEFDMVIVDTPPVLAAADAEILAVQTDAVVVVVRAGQTDRHSAQYAVQQLRAIGARVVGAVLNDPDEMVPSYGRYVYYYEGYSPRPGGD